MEEKYLPIGTVVLLKGGTKKVMINGFCAVTEAKKDKIFDYRGCPFPEGVLESSGVALFDHDQIQEIVHIGYKHAESINFFDKLEIIVKSKAYRY
ncbi:MAG: DUF4176 domain-containing protein [Bacilli bacterium]|nr:DUF4176 domain-containing protein [Bacilli bacterium]